MNDYFLLISLLGIVSNFIVIILLAYSLCKTFNRALLLFELGAVSHFVVQSIYLCMTLQKWLKIEIISKSYGELFQKMIMFFEPTGIILCAIAIILIARANWGKSVTA